MLLFHQSTMRIILPLIRVSTYVTWYSCKIFVQYITFLIHRKLRTVCILSPNPITIKLGFWGILGGCMGCSLVKSGFSCIA